MSASWHLATLDEVATVVGRGIAPKYSAEGTGGLPVLNQRCVRDGRVDFSLARRHDQTQRAVPERKVLKPGDIIVNSTGVGTLGRTAPIRWVSQQVTVDSHLTIVRPAPTVDADWLAYAISNAEPSIEAMAEGSTGQTELSRHRLASLQLEVPPLPEQRRIAALLRLLDDKIQSNSRKLELIDEQYHFRWRRLYDRIDDSKRTRLADVVRTQYGHTASADQAIRDVKFLRVTDINKRNWIDWDKVPGVALEGSELAKFKLEAGDLLVARMADPGKSAIFDVNGEVAVFASYLVRLKPRDYDEALFIYGFLKSSDYTAYAEGAKSGSVQKNMNAKVIVDTELKWPTADQLREFAAVAGVLRRQIGQLTRESSRLALLRDTLLPGLLSGSVRAPTGVVTI